jgi:hypothetical protein
MVRRPAHWCRYRAEVKAMCERFALIDWFLCKVGLRSLPPFRAGGNSATTMLIIDHSLIITTEISIDDISLSP